MLVRFRADPKKIRVSVRHEGEGVWAATVASREVPSSRVSVLRSDPKSATDAALIAYGDLYHLCPQVDGLDLGMGWAYEHPWKTG